MIRRRWTILDEPLILPETFASRRGDEHLFFRQDTGACVVVNEAAAEVLELLRSSRSPRQVVEHLGARHSLPRSRVERSVETLLAGLVERGFLTASDAPPDPATPRPAPAGKGLSVVYLHLTNRCNLACSYCYNAQYRARRPSDEELSEREVRELLDQAAASGARQVTFTGGEPLLRPDLLELAEHARGLGLEASLLTNGTLIRERAEQIAGRFDLVVASLDGWRSEEHDHARGKGSHEGAAGGIRNLVAAGAGVYVRAVVTRRNVGSLPSFPRYAAAALGCTDFMLALCMPADVEQAAELLPDPGEYRSALDGFHSALQEIGGTSNFETEPFLSDGGCGAGANILSVAPNGDVFPCQCLMRADLRIGNVRERSLEEIHRDSSSLLEAGRGATPLASCAGCPVSGLCTLRCQAVLGAFEGPGQALVELLCPLSRVELEHRLWNEASRLVARSVGYGDGAKASREAEGRTP